MHAMRLEYHKGRSHKARKGEQKQTYSDKHNDRNFDLSTDEKINPDLTPYNTYINHIGEENETFADAELRYYEEHFRAALDSYNATKIKRRHAKDCKTMEQFKNSPIYAPEDCVIQIGNTFDWEDMTEDEQEKVSDLLEEGVKQFTEWHNSRFKPVNGCHIDFLNTAIHVDEINDDGGAVPIHAHIRSCYVALDDNGHEIPAEDKCLAALGYEPYDIQVKYIDKKTKEEKTKTHTVTRKTQYTDDCRQKLLDIYSDLGLDMIRKPKERGKSGLAHQAYVTQQSEKRAEAAEKRAIAARKKMFVAEKRAEAADVKCVEADEYYAKTKADAEEYYSSRFKQAIKDSKDKIEQIKTDSETVSDFAAQAQALFEQYQAAINRSCSDEAEQLKKYMQSHKYSDGTTFYERYQQEQQQNKEKIIAWNHKLGSLKKDTDDINRRYISKDDEYQR